MLQIISGKFFTRDELNEQECDSVLYSNYSWIGPVLTSNMQLRPIAAYASRVAAYAVRYTSRYEAEVEEGDKKRQAVLVHPHHVPAVHQFRLLCCFFFQAFFHEDPQYVESLCRRNPRHSEDATVPSQFVPRFFDLDLSGTNEEATQFPAFVDMVLGMPRTKYKLFISCLKTFVDALESIETNFDLAYSIFVYLLETLSKDGDEYAPQWDDYEPKTRSRLDKVLESRGTSNRRRISSRDASTIREVLLDHSHLKLTQRFVDGIAALIDDEFFLGEANDRQNAIPRSQLKQLLRNLHKTRSSYVHALQTLHDQLRTPGFVKNGEADVFIWDNEPFLTLAGVVRLTHHALRNYMKRQPQLTKEDYPDWRGELPGIITIKLGPQYWIWQSQGAIGQRAHSRFSGVVAHFLETFQCTGRKLTDLSSLVAEIESVLEQTNLEHRKSLLGIYVLWNTVIVESAKSPNRDAILGKHGSLLDACSIQSFSVEVILRDTPVRWTGEECESCLAEYERRRFKQGAIALPRRLEIALAVETANRFLDEGKQGRFAQWMRHATMDAAGMPEVQDEIARAVSSRSRLSPRPLLDNGGRESAGTSG